MPTASSQQDMHVSHYQTNAGESSKRKKTPDLFFFFLFCFVAFLSLYITVQLLASWQRVLGMELRGRGMVRMWFLGDLFLQHW